MSPLRSIVFFLAGYAALLSESALGYLLRRAHAFFATPELSLLVIVYLGLSGRGGPIGLTCSALGVGYLRDLLVGAPRGVEALSFALCALCARLLHGRVFVDRYGQLAIVCASFAVLHGALLMLLEQDVAARTLVPVAVSALCCGPIVMRLMRRIDQRVAPEQRTLSMDGLR